MNLGEIVKRLQAEKAVAAAELEQLGMKREAIDGLMARIEEMDSGTRAVCSNYFLRAPQPVPEMIFTDALRGSKRSGFRPLGDMFGVGFARKVSKRHLARMAAKRARRLNRR